MTETGTAETVIDGYAKAIVAVAEAEGALERVEEELFQFARAIEGSPDLRERLLDPSIETSAKVGLVTDLLGERAHPQTVSAAAFVVQSGRARQLPQIADAVVAAAAAFVRCDRVSLTCPRTAGLPHLRAAPSR